MTIQFPLRGVADHVNLGLIPSSEAGWPVACAALCSDKGGWLHVHGNVTSGLTDSIRTASDRTVSTLSSTETSFLPSDKPRMASCQSTLDDKHINSEQTSSPSMNELSDKMTSNDELGHIQGVSTFSTKSPVLEVSVTSLHSSKVSDTNDLLRCEKNQRPSCNKKVKAEWLHWAKYVAPTLLQHLKKSHDNQNWNVQIRHIEHVKSYAPHIDHVVLDVECRPLCGHA